MAVTLYRWDDASAPVLNGTAGSLIAVLDACLVNGYGSKAALGWTKEFSGTNAAAYRAAGGTRRWLDVVETSTTQASLRGYGAMTALSTGTDPFPTVAQMSSGITHYKAAAGTTPRPWVLVGDAKRFYLISNSSLDATSAGMDQAYTNTASQGSFFGDLVSYVPGDTWQAALIGSAASGATPGQLGVVNSFFSTVVGHYLARAYDQVTGSLAAISKHRPRGYTNVSVMGATGDASNYPDPAHGGMNLERVYVGEVGGSGFRVTRGHMPGMWQPLHNRPGTPMDTFTGRAGTALAGKTFVILPVQSQTTAGSCCIEISDTWE